MPTHHDSDSITVTHTVTDKTIPLLATHSVAVAGAHRIEEHQLERSKVRVVIADWAAPGDVDRWPVSEPLLSKEFARVTDERSLLDFSNRHGLLGYSKLHEAEMRRRAETWQGDPVPWALAHARVVAGIYEIAELFNNVRNRKIKLDDRTTPLLLRTLFREFKKMGVSVGLQREPSPLTVVEWRRPEAMMSESYTLLRKKFSSRWGKDPIGTAYYVLSWILNQYVRRVHFEFVSSDYERRFFGMSSEKPRFGIELCWDELIEVIYWQLAERIGGAFRLCRRCSRTFPLSTGKDLYCSDKCGAAFRSQRYRGNKRKKRRKSRKARGRRRHKTNAASYRRSR
jgi:hypothetical protein